MKRTGIPELLACLLALCLSPLVLAEVKPLTEYREASRMWMGAEEGYIRPASYEQFRRESAGNLLVLAKDGQMLKKGEHWATLDPEQLELERRSAALEEARAVRRQQDTIQDAKEQHLRRVRELNEAEAQLTNMRGILRDGDLDALFKKRVTEAMAEQEQKIAMLRQQTTAEALQQELDLIREDFSLQEAQRARQLQSLEKFSMLTAKAPGKLSLSATVKQELADATDPGQPVWIRAGELIGSIANEDQYEITVSATGPLLTGIPTEQLLVFFQDPQTGQLIEGLYLRTDERDNGKQILRDFVFKASDKSIESARRASGTTNTVHVYRKFEKPYRIVMKKDLVFSDPDTLEKVGWVGLVQKLWPGCQVIQIAPQSIAVDPGQ